MPTDAFDGIIGTSAAAQAMRTFGHRAAAVDAPVLLLGESGTGKGVLARAIHRASPRAARPFVAVNCAAVPETLFESEFFGHVRGAFTGAQYAHKGLFEQADGGTLFLDEVGELPMPMQAKLLTVLEDRIVRRVGAERSTQVEVRVIAATAVDLTEHVARKLFRADLFHRLSILCFDIAPLRQRVQDIPLLAQFLIDDLCARHRRRTPTLTREAMAALGAHPWPGNVRELSNVLERALLLKHSDTLAPAHFSLATPRFALSVAKPEFDGNRYSFLGTTEEEQAAIRAALQQCRGNKTRAATMLGMSRNTLLNKLRTIGL